MGKTRGRLSPVAAGDGLFITGQTSTSTRWLHIQAGAISCCSIVSHRVRARKEQRSREQSVKKRGAGPSAGSDHSESVLLVPLRPWKAAPALSQ